MVKAKMKNAAASPSGDTTSIIRDLDSEYGLGLPIRPGNASQITHSFNKELAEHVLKELLALGPAELRVKLDQFRSTIQKQQKRAPKSHEETSFGNLPTRSQGGQEASLRCLSFTLTKGQYQHGRPCPMKRPSDGVDKQLPVKMRDGSATESPRGQPLVSSFFYLKPKRGEIFIGSSSAASVPSDLAADLSLDDFALSNNAFEEESRATLFETAGYDEPDGPLKESLRGVWPRLNAKGVDGKPLDVPFAVLWEIHRIALHCNVDICARKAKIDIGNDWKDQNLLRAKLQASELFANKSFPSKNDDTAWRVALDSGQKREKAVTYAIDFSYNRSPGKPLYKAHLRPLTLDVSHRMIRRFGADRWLELNLPSPAADPPPTMSGHSRESSRLQDQARLQIVKWLVAKDHQFLGRSWAAIFLSDEQKTKTRRDPVSEEKITEQVFSKKIRLFATNGDGFRPLDAEQDLPLAAAALVQTDRQNVSQPKVIQWAIGVTTSENQRQLALKLFSRLQLVFSRTIPTVLFQESEIIHIKEKIGSHADMADGAGLISVAAARKVAALLGLSYVPCGFQVRIGGCKGMLMIDTTSNVDERIYIKTFPSQRKFVCDYSDPLHRTLDVKDWAKPLKSATLNFQFIVILDNNADDKKAMRARLEHHLEESLKEELTSLQDVMSHPQDLRSWIRQFGRSSDERASHGLVKYLGGAPKNPEEELALMLDSGFTVSQKYICDLLKEVVNRKAEWLRGKLKVLIPCSTYAFMLPDFTGTLEEDEISLCFSQQFKADEFDDNWLEGDVIVTRSPAHTPSDMQKVRAVVRPELRKFRDIVIFSTKGKLSLAEKLSGGDFDGDKACLIWDPEIVKHFRNDEHLTPSDLGLDHDTTTFQEILRSEAKKSAAVKIHTRIKSQADRKKKPTLTRAVHTFLERAFDFNTREGLLGICTKYKESFAYQFSPKTSKALRLSSLLSLLVDAPKQGTLFYKTEWDKFRHDNALPPILRKPAYESKGAKPQKTSQNDHVLDWLLERAEQRIARFQIDFAAALDAGTHGYQDSDLSRLRKLWIPDDVPGRRLLTQLRTSLQPVADRWPLTRNSKDFGVIVQMLHDEWMAIRPSAEFESRFKETFVTGPNARHEGDFALLLASVAFDRWANSKPKFGFRMAGRSLCRLKALATGMEDSAPVLVVPHMYAALKPDRKLIEQQALRRMAGEEETVDCETEDDEF